MRSRFWVAYGALALAFALLVPTLAPLSGSMDSFAKDLANGAFRPFGSGKTALKAFSGSLGGFTGESQGNYVPGAGEIPPSWVMDRDGRGGNVVIDAVFNPSIGAMKRLKAYDKLEADGQTLTVSGTTASGLPRLRPYLPDALHVRYDTPIEGKYTIQLRAGDPIPIFSPHPRAEILSFSFDPPLNSRPAFLQDNADTLYILSSETATVNATITFRTEARYYLSDLPPGMSVDDYAPSMRPTLPPGIIEDAKVVLARAGAGDGRDLGLTLDALNAYFRSFREGDIPPPSEVESLYQALALGGRGCCRHRAFAYMVTAQSLGIPTRVVVNEAHAFVEVTLPDGSFRQFNLGGCGTYTVNNPENHKDLFSQSSDPRREANPNEDRPLPTVPTFTNITDSPARIIKGERYIVNGTVESPGGRAVPGARIDLFLNETKGSKGRLSGAGTTDAQGHFSIVARVPRDLPARSYQLVARALDPGAGQIRYLESWSDPEISVFAPTKFLFPQLVAAAGFPANITGRLVDLDNSAVAGAVLTWSADGVEQDEVRTDGTGRFSAVTTFPTRGARPVSFQFAGGEHHGAANIDLVVQVGDGAILLPADAPTLARGETGHLNGSIAIAGRALGGQRIQAVLHQNDTPARALAGGEAITTATGAFSIPIDVRGNLLAGVYAVSYDVADIGLHAAGLARVAIRPTLTIDAPSSIPAAEGWELRATLASDNGTLLSGGIVEIVVDGNVTNTRALLTNTSGVARFEFPSRGLGTGTHSIRVSFPGDATHADTSQTIQVEAIQPWFAMVPPWVYAVALGALALILLVGWILRPGGVMGRAFGATRAPRDKRWRIEVTFPDHPHGVAPVFERGDPARVNVRVRHRDGHNVSARVLMETTQGKRKGRVDGTGWECVVAAPEVGPLVLRVRALGWGHVLAVPVDVSVPIHSYRHAVEEGFVALRRRAQLSESASPGDLVRTLGPRLASAHQHKLREAATMFEVADYSDRPVDRAFYHAFAVARRDLERALEAASDG